MAKVLNQSKFLEALWSNYKEFRLTDVAWQCVTRSCGPGTGHCHKSGAPLSCWQWATSVKNLLTTLTLSRDDLPDPLSNPSASSWFPPLASHHALLPPSATYHLQPKHSAGARAPLTLIQRYSETQTARQLLSLLSPALPSPFSKCQSSNLLQVCIVCLFPCFCICSPVLEILNWVLLFFLG